MEYQGRRRAAALHYTREQEGAPSLVAKGDDEFAEQILAVARDHHVPIHQDPALVGLLSRMNLDEQIPPELFVAIAAVLGFIYRLEAEQEAAASTSEQDTPGPPNPLLL